MSKAPPRIITDRCIVYRHEIKRPENLGGMSRTVFHAWLCDDDVPHPICIVTINECFGDYVEWIHVHAPWRRCGIATEVLRAIELKLGCLTLEGVTEEGVGFCEAYEAKYPSEVV